MDHARQLSVLWSTTQVQLEAAWRQVGLSLAEQKTQLELLYQDFEAIAKRKIETEAALCNAYVDEVAKLKVCLSSWACCTSFSLTHTRIYHQKRLTTEPMPKKTVQEDIKIVAKRLDLPGDYSVPAAETTFLLRELTWLRGTYQRLDDQRSKMEFAAEEKMQALHAVWTEMGQKFEPGFTEVGFKLGGRREAFEMRLSKALEERAHRVKEVRAAASSMANLLEELEFDMDTEFDQAVASRDERLIGISNDVVKALEQRTSELIRLKEQRVSLLKQLGAQIQPLWERLGVFPAERQVFFERNSGLGKRVVDACEKELARLTELKRSRMADFIEASRAQIRAALDETRASTLERARLAPLLAEPVPEIIQDSEMLLTRHEGEMARLEQILEVLRPIIRACSKYLALCEDRNEYEELVQDSSRLLNRKRGGPSLREEEQLRIRVAKDIPKTVAFIQQAVPEYQKQVLGGAPLILADLFGEDAPVLSVIARHEQEHDDKLAREKEQKKGKLEEKSKPPQPSGMVANKPRVPLAAARPKNQ